MKHRSACSPEVYGMAWSDLPISLMDSMVVFKTPTGIWAFILNYQCGVQQPDVAGKFSLCDVSLCVTVFSPDILVQYAHLGYKQTAELEFPSSFCDYIL